MPVAKVRLTLNTRGAAVVSAAGAPIVRLCVPVRFGVGEPAEARRRFGQAAVVFLIAADPDECMTALVFGGARAWLPAA